MSKKSRPKTDQQATQKLPVIETAPKEPAKVIASTKPSVLGDEPLAVILLGIVILFLLILVLLTTASI